MAGIRGAGEPTGFREGWRCAVTDAIVTIVHDAFDIGADEGAEPSWQDRALCAQTDPEAFFPEKGGSTREAKRVCRGCEVRAECLEYALAHDERFGIWGGLSERERRRLKRQAG
jgi:WhiB family redox-sensing transcriptional regulator